MMFDSIKVGRQGTGGVTFFNGTIVNNTTNNGIGNPVTFGDDVRIDGVIYRTELGGTYPLKLGDTLMPAENNAYSLGTADYRFKDGYLTGTLTVGTLATSSLSGSGIVSSDNLADNAVTTAKIAAGAVTESDLADSAVTSVKINNGTITASDLADSSVTSAKVVDGAIGSGDLADSAVTSAKISDGSIASDDLADSIITTNKIANGTIAGADVNSAESFSMAGLTLTGNVTQSAASEGALKGWAYVGSNGTLYDSWNVLSSTQIATGQYEVRFNFDLATTTDYQTFATKAIVAVPSGIDGAIAERMIGAGPKEDTTDTVLINASDKDGNFANSVFMLAVF